MKIPFEQLNYDTLINLIESFVLREGTDYGETERTLEEKVQEIFSQLRQGKLNVQYSEEYESVNIVPNDD